MTNTTLVPIKTLQEIFDFGLAHIRQQGEPCRGSDGTCKYRNDEGQSCIVGGFLTPETYLPEFDSVECGGTSVYNLMDRLPSFRAAMLAAGVDVADTKVRNLLSWMQHCHDSAPLSVFIPSFNGLMRKVANDFGLAYTEPKEVTA